MDGQARVVIECLSPIVDYGRWPAKRIAGETVLVEADIYADGHDAIHAQLLWREAGESEWRRVPMTFLNNDRWQAGFRPRQLGYAEYTVEAWIDQWLTWRRDLKKRLAAGQDVAVDLLIGANLIGEAAHRAPQREAAALRQAAAALRQESTPAGQRAETALADELHTLMEQFPDTSHASRRDPPLLLKVDRERARFSAWYELFPRSCSGDPHRHGTFADVERHLPYVAELGFDILYLPPIHPVGTLFRKGKNNTLTPGPDDVGSPWAIGNKEGGHTAILPELGTMADFERLVAAARRLGIDIALDVAFQCSPDHPWPQKHPEWFKQRPDGTIQYAENPPKKYQDIYPINFETPDWQALWRELKGVFTFWIEHGVRVFRVDNPHTKSLAFWEWCMAGLSREHPDVIFLSEAFTRPKLLKRLAKLGYTQSYNYFPWRNTKQELTEYLTELTQTPVREYLRPSLWPNTPDILTEYLQHGGRPGFIARFVLAATMGASYGIYGPAFELLEHVPAKPGSEEYLHSEKYQLRQWDLHAAHSIAPLIARVNRARREHPALQQDWTLHFHDLGNPELICYSKTDATRRDAVLVIVNLDYRHTQSGWTNLDLAELGLQPGQRYKVHDVLSDAIYEWQGPRNYVELRPQDLSAHVFVVYPE